MIRTLIQTICFLLIASAVFAQNASPTSLLSWVPQSSAGPATVTEANQYTYRYYPENGTNGITLTGVSCFAVANGVECTVPFPAFTPGSHTLTMTAMLPGDPTSESGRSEVLAFTFTVKLLPPTKLTIKTSPVSQ